MIGSLLCGFLVYFLDLLLLTCLARFLLFGATMRRGSGRIKVTVFLVAIKVLILGGGTYLTLVLWAGGVWAYILGAVLALVFYILCVIFFDKNLFRPLFLR